MPRKKPFSNKQRKAQLQEKRAIKRGDISPPPVSRHPKGHKRPATARSVASTPAIESSKRLQSAFVKFSADYLARSRLVSSFVALPRPLSPDVATFSPPDPLNPDIGGLSCPKRPKWRYEMSKKEVEKNEEGLFNKWLAQTDQVLQNWVNEGDLKTSQGEEDSDANLTMPRAPTQYERNLEVWRQLWRVTEISQIILILLDSRCPLLHYPPSLASYLSNLQNRKIILVITKVDISGIDRANAWTSYLNSLFPDVRIVHVEAYIPMNPESYEAGTSKRHQRYEPHLPQGFRERLVLALKEVHAELLEPPAHIRDDEERLKRWRPPVKRDIDWTAALSAHGGMVGGIIGGPAAARPTNSEGDSPDISQESDLEPEFLTIGLIGQPNVGKSSLLNALFGSIKVRASRTPGKTKHFQTLFWTPDVRLVDCPGLVMPNFVEMEMQVLSGILPISRVSAVPACIYYVSHYLPLEKIFKLVHPSLKNPTVIDKRTWREDRQQSPPKEEDPPWTAMDVLVAYASVKNWVTAKAGRPDINRAGNAILRALAEGKIKWAFWPPGASDAEGTENGIWISGDEAEDESDQESEEDGNIRRAASDDDELKSDVDDSELDDGEEKDNVSIGGRFGALALEEAQEESVSEDGDDLESEDGSTR